ncbi:alpha-mannosidase [Ranunculus cassubicifolius]
MLSRLSSSVGGETRALRFIKQLVNSAQLEFINGGMCMHDEASPHYIDMIDQTTLGHRFIKQEFDVTPRVGWQMNPFGHSLFKHTC